MTGGGEVAPQDGRTWYEATAVDRPVRGPLVFDLDVDACVIGGGLAGLTTARELARRGWSVALLEGDRIGGAASGRNCGFVLPGFAEPITRIAERVGLEQARAMWAHADMGLAYVRKTIAETAMPGVDPVDGWLSIAKFAADPSLTEEAMTLAGMYGAAVEEWSAERVREQLRTPFYHNALHYRSAFHIHPLNYALGLAAAAEREGVRIFEATPALSIDPAGVRKRIATPSARVRAAQVVLAGNVQVAALLPRLGATLLPVTTFLAVTGPLGRRLEQVIAYRGGVSDSLWADNHYRIVDGDRLLWSGGLRTWNADPLRFGRRLRADIRRTFPQLGAIEIAHVWSGKLGRTIHKMPQIGEIASGFWILGGFGGHGLNTTAMAGVLIARAIADSDTAWQVFRPYELVWAGGGVGRTLLQVGYAGHRARARLRARWARWRAPAWRRIDDDPPREEPAASVAPVVSDPPPDAASKHREAATRRRKPGRRRAKPAAAVTEPAEAAGGLTDLRGGS